MDTSTRGGNGDSITFLAISGRELIDDTFGIIPGFLILKKESKLK